MKHLLRWLFRRPAPVEPMKNPHLAWIALVASSASKSALR